MSDVSGHSTRPFKAIPKVTLPTKLAGSFTVHKGTASVSLHPPSMSPQLDPAFTQAECNIRALTTAIQIIQRMTYATYITIDL